MAAKLVELPLPPHDLGAEDAVLSAMLCDRSALEQARSLLKPEHFYSPANRWIFSACLALAETGQPVDLVTVGAWLREQNRIVEIGGTPYLAKIIDSAPYVAHIEAYARTVRERWSARQLISATQQMVAEARCADPNLPVLLHQFRSRLDTIEREAIPEEMSTVESSTLAAPLPAVRWICEELGLAPGRPVLLSGYGGTGKTMAAQQLMLSLAAGLRTAWGGYQLQDHGRVLHLDYEQTLWITQWRYQRLAYSLKLDLADAGDRLSVASLPPVYLTDPRAEASFTRVCQGRRLCLLDNLRAACPGVEENSSQVRIYLDLLTRITERTGCCFLVIVHEGKTGPGDNRPGLQRVRGSSAIIDAASTVLSMTSESGLLRLEQTKSSLGKASEPRFLRFVDDGPIDDNTRKPKGLRLDWVPIEEVTATKDSTLGAFVQKAKQSLLGTLRKRGPLNRSDLLEATPGKTEIKRQALAELLAEGRVSYEAGARGAKVFRFNGA